MSQVSKKQRELSIKAIMQKAFDKTVKNRRVSLISLAKQEHHFNTKRFIESLETLNVFTGGWDAAKMKIKTQDELDKVVQDLIALINQPLPTKYVKKAARPEPITMTAAIKPEPLTEPFRSDAVKLEQAKFPFRNDSVISNANISIIGMDSTAIEKCMKHFNDQMSKLLGVSASRFV